MSFDDSGRLLDISVSDAVDREAGVEFYDGVLIPGLVNAHCHLELSYLRGKIGRGCGFAGFADAISQVRHEATESERRAAADYWQSRMEYDGVVVVGDICNGDSTFGIKSHSHIHYYNFIEGFGLKTTDFRFLDRIKAEAETAGLAASITPHATYSLQDAPFRALAAAGERLSIHFMESRAETELFQGKGTLHERNVRLGVEVDFMRYGSPTGRILASVPSDKELLLVHNTFITEQEIEAVQERFGEHVTWVVCPRSNNFIEGVFPPVDLLRRCGGRIAVGTDSLSSNERLSLIDELKCFPSVPLEERLRWATIGGARALGLEDRIGSFEIGKTPAAVVLSGIAWSDMSLLPDATTRRVL